jgi:serine/threonine protein kinase
MVKLLDFGIAKLVRLTPGTEKTQTGNMLGTPRYISPEQARGINVDYRSDIYSLGVMAYEMLAGRPPFQGESAMDLVVKHLGEQPPPLHQFAKVPKSLEQCVMAMLEKDPMSRPSLEEVRNILVDPSRRLTPLPMRTSAVVLPALTKPTPKWPRALAGMGALGRGLVAWEHVSNNKQAEGPAPANTEPVTTESPTSAGINTPAAGSGEQPVVEAPVARPPTRGTLEVDIQGSKDSVIYVDGEEWGRGASIKLELDPGKHKVVVKPPKTAAITKTVEIDAGSVASVAIVVPPQPGIKVRTKRPPRDRTAKPTGDDELLTPKRTK